MVTIEINELELRNRVNELVELDEDITTDSEVVNGSVDAFMARLIELPTELLAEIIADYIYAESQEEVEER